ncbi:response regulator [Paenibacillus hodogayensis]|uniref:Response regulator n=1 Tax=Paenibacillus hodogayensis TaxID=279208 RepID=A0ABV5W0D0_9BACL
MKACKRKGVFLVDDDPQTIHGLQSHVAWESMGLHVLGTAADGREALDRIRQAAIKPDIVMTDIYMPEMDGFTFIQSLRKDVPDIRLIILSGYEEFENARQAMRYGVQHFLLKPASRQEIEFVLRETVQEIDIQLEEATIRETYIRQFTDNLPRIRDSFFRELLVTRYAQEELSSEKPALIGFPSLPHLIAASIELVRPPYLGKNQERHWQLLKFGAGNIVNELAAQSIRQLPELTIHAVDFTDERFVIVLLSTTEAGMEEAALALAEQALDKILLFLKLSAVAGIGRRKQGYHHLIDSYLESQQALKAAEYDELNNVYQAADNNDREESEPFRYPLSAIQQMHDALNRQDLDLFNQSWLAIKESIQTHKLPLYMMQTLCTSVLSSMQLAASNAQPGPYSENEMSNLMEQMYAQSTAAGLRIWMDDFIAKWKGEIGRGQESNTLIKQVKSWVSQHYGEDISFQEIAQSLYVGRTYLSHLFKRVTGETFSQYLMHYRIAKATELLRTKQYMVYEVSQMVGYQNPTYFSQVFKSVNGYSPTDCMNWKHPSQNQER